jgi:hypothetical protein
MTPYEVCILSHARAWFMHYGGARGDYENNEGKVCALGALRTTLSAYGYHHHGTFAPWITYLDVSALKLYGMRITHVNDRIGFEAVMDVFNNVLNIEEEKYYGETV